MLSSKPVTGRAVTSVLVGSTFSSTTAGGLGSLSTASTGGGLLCSGRAEPTVLVSFSTEGSLSSESLGAEVTSSVADATDDATDSDSVFELSCAAGTVVAELGMLEGVLFDSGSEEGPLLESLDCCSLTTGAGAWVGVVDC